MFTVYICSPISVTLFEFPETRSCRRFSSPLLELSCLSDARIFQYHLNMVNFDYFISFNARERENNNNINTVELSVFVGELENMFVEVRLIVISPAVWL